MSLYTFNVWPRLRTARRLSLEETNREAAIERIRQAVLNCELAKARATCRALMAARMANKGRGL
jgi:hypothetical protein